MNTTAQIAEPSKCNNCGREVTTDNPAVMRQEPGKIVYCQDCTTVKDFKLKAKDCMELYNQCLPDAAKAPAHDPVNHPSHYTSHPSGVECIQITRHMNFNLGNAIKYLWRGGLKHASPCIEDLKKARWYIADEIKRLGGTVE